MKVVITKDVTRPSGKVWKPGTNVLVGRTYGNELVGEGVAVEVPEQKGEFWNLQGSPSENLKKLRKPEAFPVTVKELERLHPDFKKKTK